MDNIIDYITNTPANSNPNVLRDMLQTNSSSGGGNIMIIRPIDVNREETTEIADLETGGVRVLVNTQVTYDKTWQEVYDALAANVPVYLDATTLALARMENNYFNTSGGDETESGGDVPTLAAFEEIRTNTVVLVPITTIFKAPTPDADGMSYFALGFTLLYNMEGDFWVMAASSNVSLTDQYFASYLAPEDYPEEQQAETGEG